MPVQNPNQLGGFTLSAPEMGIEVRSPGEVRGVRETTGLQVSSTSAGTDGESSALPEPSDAYGWTFQVTWAAESPLDDLRTIHDDMLRMSTKQPRLGRRPLVLITWMDYALEGWLSAYEPVWPHGVFQIGPGNPRVLEATLTVSRARPRSLEATSSNALEPQTRWVTIGEGETFESVAYQHLGDPMLGVLLRRINPHIRLGGEQAGDIIRVLERTHSEMQRPIAPESPPFVGNYAQSLQAFAEERLSAMGPSLAELESELGL
ncbi:MAG: hypothetical protein AB7U23_13240 [Dehalococcoidia bacterium]